MAAPELQPQGSVTRRSIEELQECGPGVVEHASNRAFFRRIGGFQIDEVKLTKFEYGALIVDGQIANRSAQFLAWRRSLLTVGSTLFALLWAVDCSLMVFSTYISDSNVLLNDVSERYRKHFDNMQLMDQIESTVLSVASCAAVSFAALAACYWKSFTRSGAAVLASFLCSYVPPFLLMLLMPYRSGVDFRGIQRQVCFDTLGSTQGYVDTVRNVLEEQFSWPEVGSGNFANKLKELYGVVLPENLCARDFSTWATTITNFIEDRGFVMDENGHCPAVYSTLSSLNQLAVGDAVCPDACAECDTTCKPYLAQLAQLAFMQPPDQPNQDAIQTELENAGTPVSLQMASCLYCVSVDTQFQCPWKCAELNDEFLQQSVSVPSAGGQALQCFDPEKFKDFKILSKAATQTVYWEFLLGCVYAVGSILRLLPLSFSLLLGAAKGSGIAKSALPYSRLPGVVSTAAVVFTFPFLLQTGIVVQNSIGSIYTLFAIIFWLAGFLCSIQPALLTVQSHQALYRRELILNIVRWSFFAIGIAFFVMAFFLSETLSEVQKAYEEACSSSVCITEEQKQKIQEELFMTLFRLISTFLGKSLVSIVFFSDIILLLSHHFHWHEIHDPLEVQTARVFIVEDLHSICAQGAHAKFGPGHPDPQIAAQIQQGAVKGHTMVPVDTLQAMMARLHALDGSHLHDATTMGGGLGLAGHHATMREVIAKHVGKVGVKPAGEPHPPLHQQPQHPPRLDLQQQPQQQQQPPPSRHSQHLFHRVWERICSVW